MALYQAEVWFGSASGRQPVQVRANTINGAKEQLISLYRLKDPVNEINGLREIKETTSTTTESGDTGNTGAIIGLAALGAIGFVGLVAIFLVMVFLPEVLLATGAVAALKGVMSLKQKDMEMKPKVALCILVTIASLASGYYGGKEIHNMLEYDRTEDISNIKKTINEMKGK